jgi:hypothetical protein
MPRVYVGEHPATTSHALRANVPPLCHCTGTVRRRGRTDGIAPPGGRRPSSRAA